MGGMVTLYGVTMKPFGAHGHAKAKRDHATLFSLARDELTRRFLRPTKVPLHNVLVFRMDGRCGAGLDSLAARTRRRYAV